MKIRPYRPEDQEPIIQLWQACGLLRPWNNPYLDIERKLDVQPELFLVGVDADQNIIGSVMAGYDGHRGWVNYLAVAPDKRRSALGRQLMHAAETELAKRGCPKLNLQVRVGNDTALAFYQSLGYLPDDVVSLGKRLISDLDPQ
ncbi:GNAT family acetyltransferase [Methylomonas koyamae]|uniref:GNAT family acetyltransferase n=1 Tax=Methylomonas koyamae TaxID=702114 RepID=UPI001C322378|nr:GNAT family acetyltransferase [Methylomonas koyamae]BBL58540.1 putative N-acetyltransferase [Methylomonas koyamae]